MLTRLRKTVFCLFICSGLIFSSSSFASGVQLDFFLTGESDSSLSFRISSPEYQKLAQFDGERLTQLNRLLKHFSISATSEGTRSETSVLIDNEKICSVFEKTTETGTEQIWLCQPDNMARMSGNDQLNRAENIISFLDDSFYFVNRMTDFLYPLVANLPAAFPDLQKENKTDLRLSGYGKATRRLSFSFPADYVQEHFPEAVAALTESEECRRFFSALHFSGNQKISFLLDQEDHMIRVNYDGKAGFSEEDLRNVSLVWKCLRTQTQKKDSFTLKTPAVKGYDRYNIIYERDLNHLENGQQTLSWDYQVDCKTGQEKQQKRFSAEMSMNEAALEGKMDFTDKHDKQSEKKSLVVSMNKEKNEEYEGTIEFTDYSGKIIGKKIVSRLSLSSGSVIQWPDTGHEDHAADQPGASFSDPEAVRLMMLRAIVRRVVTLPQEDILFISNGISEKTWADITH